MSPGFGSCAVTVRLTTLPGATVTAEAARPSITGAALLWGGGGVTCWAVMTTVVVCPAVMVTPVTTPWYSSVPAASRADSVNTRSDPAGIWLMVPPHIPPVATRETTIGFAMSVAEMVTVALATSLVLRAMTDTSALPEGVLAAPPPLPQPPKANNASPTVKKTTPHLQSRLLFMRVPFFHQSPKGRKVPKERVQRGDSLVNPGALSAPKTSQKPGEWHAKSATRGKQKDISPGRASTLTEIEPGGVRVN